MLRQILSAIQNDDNPRLHRIPFLLWWMMSYGLGWYAIYVYEHLWYDRRFCAFMEWLSRTPPYGLREGLFVGFIYGVILALIQVLLIRARYGYVPRFWFIATLIGATFAGYGYPRVGNSVGGWYPMQFVPNFLLWFSILGLVQSIGIWRASRKAWLVFVMSSIASGMAITSLFYPRPFYYDPPTAVVFGTLIQSLGTGLLVLYAMANPREGSVPKREKAEGMKFQPHDGLAARHFVSLWICVYYFAQIMNIVIFELWYLVRRYTSDELYQSIRPYSLIIIFGSIGLVVAIAEHWLMKKYSQYSIRYWYVFTIAGWVLAGYTAIQRFNYDADYTRLQDNFFLGASIALPLLAQAIPMNRAIRGGWLWAVVGILSSVLLVYYQNIDWFSRMRLLYGTIFCGLFMSLTTACLFLWLAARNISQTPIEGVETE